MAAKPTRKKTTASVDTSGNSEMWDESSLAFMGGHKDITRIHCVTGQIEKTFAPTTGISDAKIFSRLVLRSS